MKIKDIVKVLEAHAPKSLQESYDNVGIQVGNAEQEVTGVLLTLDCTEEVVAEAHKKNCNLIIAHHPVIFGGLKRIAGNSYVERVVRDAIKNDITIYAAHTNLDNVKDGVNKKICDKLGLENCEVLASKKGEVSKLAVFVPEAQAVTVREAIFKAGAGVIGAYDSCSFNISGKGTFRAGDGTAPFVGKQGELHEENEVRLETIVPNYLASKVIAAMVDVHPYEEVAYDLYPLSNTNQMVGSGMIGEIAGGMKTNKFLDHIKSTFNAGCVRYTNILTDTVKRVAVCGGSGSFLLSRAIAAGADIFITADFKYHQFFDAEDKIVIADIGHYESEQFTTEVFADILKENFPTFAVHFTETNTNPINYL